MVLLVDLRVVSNNFVQQFEIMNGFRMMAMVRLGKVTFNFIFKFYFICN